MMGKRVFILGTPNFPRGSAGANYAQYLALALMECDYKVIIIGTGKNKEKDQNGDSYIYKGIEYRNEPNGRIQKYGLSISFYKQMYKKFGMSNKDFYILHDIGFLAQKWLAKRVGTSRMCYIHYEDLLPIQYRHHLVNPRYWGMLLKWNFKLNHVEKAFPISERLKHIEETHGCKDTLLLPIMSDPDEFDESVKLEKPEKLRFIYSGAKQNSHEDDLIILFKALQELSTEEKNSFELHITGTNSEKLKARLNGQADTRGLNLVLHGWMEYMELIELYRSVDFLLLPRFDNAVTQANFPSKIPEVMAFGIIPVCSAVGDYTNRYLSQNDCITFKCGSVEDCLGAIKKAIHMDSEKYISMRRAARKVAVTQFGYKNWSERIASFLMK